MFWPKIVPNSWQYQSMFPFHALTSLVFLPCQHPNMTSSGPTNPHTASIVMAAKETMGSRVSFCMYSLIFNGTYSLLYSNPFLSLFMYKKQTSLRQHKLTFYHDGMKILNNQHDKHGETEEMVLPCKTNSIFNVLNSIVYFYLNASNDK